MNDTQTASKLFHQHFDADVRTLIEPAREQLIESLAYDECPTREIILGQILMIELGDADRLNASTKQRLVALADWMGPDWCQALYHAAVFMTKVA